MVCERDTSWLRMGVRLNPSERVNLAVSELSTRTLGSALKEVWFAKIRPIYWGLPRKWSLEVK